MAATKTILRVSAFYHDSAAALVREGDIIAAMPVWLKEKPYLKSTL